MSRLHYTTRAIGSVKVFDLLGEPAQESLQEVAWKMQQSIRRHRLQRVILNVQKIKFLDELGVRKLVAAFLRPRKSAIYGASDSLTQQFEGTYLPGNIRLCRTEKEIAEDFGPFLFHKDELGHILGDEDRTASGDGVGMKMEKRRSKRMHVAIPLEITLKPGAKPLIHSRGISTNISEGGIFVEFLDLNTLKEVEKLEPAQGVAAEIQIHPSENFPDEYQLQGVVQRRELRKRGLGLAIRFTNPKGEN